MFKGLLAKIIALGTKKVIAVCVASVVAVGTVASGAYVIVEKMNSEKQEAEKVLQDEVKQTVRYEAENLILEGEGLAEGYTLEIIYFGGESDEYQRAFNSINGATTSVTALEVFEIKLVDKEGNEVELENEVALKITLQDATKKASGEYLLWDSEMIIVKDAEFQDSMVSFSTSKLGTFVISKTEKVEVDESELDKDKATETDETANVGNNTGTTTTPTTQPTTENSSNNSSTGNGGGTTTPTETPNESTAPTTAPEEYITLKMYEVTTYYGVKGYFTNEWLGEYELVEYGLAETNEGWARCVTEYYDPVANVMIGFVIHDEIDGRDRRHIRDAVDNGPGRSSTPVNVIY